MAAITREAEDRYRVRFDALPRGGFGFGKREPVPVDPFLVGRALAEVMRACTARSATGRRLLWNDYRVILARGDFERLRPLSATLERDLREVLVEEAKSRDAELVGELRLAVVADEGDELPVGEAVVRTAFVPTSHYAPAVDADMTAHVDGPRASGENTVAVPEEAGARGPRYGLRWPGGSTMVAFGHFVVVGRPHPDAPGRFVPLHGASPKINKQHFVLATHAEHVTIGRLPQANPVSVNGQPLAAGAEVKAKPPVRISLSRDDLVVELFRV